MDFLSDDSYSGLHRLRRSVIASPDHVIAFRAYARMSLVEQRHDVSLEDQERQLRELAQAYYADR